MFVNFNDDWPPQPGPPPRPRPLGIAADDPRRFQRMIVALLPAVAPIVAVTLFCIILVLLYA